MNHRCPLCRGSGIYFKPNYITNREMFVNRPNDEIAAILTVEVPCPLEGIFWHDLPLPRLKDRRTFLALVGIEAFCREADIYGAENFPPVYFMERL